MEFLPADYVILGCSVIAAIIGLFIGFSGASAFLSATVCAWLAGWYGWEKFASNIDSKVGQVIFVAIVAVVAFGVVRVIIRRLVNGLIRQPGDAIFGAIAAAVTVLLFMLVIDYTCLNSFGMESAKSNLLQYSLTYL